MNDAKIYFVIKIPKKNYKAFSILKEIRKNNSREYSKINSETLDAINKSILSKQRKSNECLAEVREIVQKLYSSIKNHPTNIVHNFDNCLAFFSSDFLV